MIDTINRVHAGADQSLELGGTSSAELLVCA